MSGFNMPPGISPSDIPGNEPPRYGSLREKIAAEKAERANRYRGFADLWAQAHAAGMAAGNAVRPTPMIVRNGSIRINGQPLNPYAPDGQIIDVVADGACGFAWVTVHPATSSFARWCAKVHGSRRAYGGGMQVKWVAEFNQSMARKEAYARAFADVLNTAGIKAYAGSRMD